MTDNGPEDRDTVSGCRAHASDDLSNAAASDTANGRAKYERSAASWTARADSMEAQALGAGAQRLTDKALWDSEEDEADQKGEPGAR